MEEFERFLNAKYVFLTKLKNYSEDSHRYAYDQFEDFLFEKTSQLTSKNKVFNIVILPDGFGLHDMYFSYDGRTVKSINEEKMKSAVTDLLVKMELL